MRVLGVIVVALLTGCVLPQNNACTAGDARSCTCSSGALGSQTCQADGTYDACTCGTDLDAGHDAGGSQDSGSAVDGGDDAGVTDAGQQLQRDAGPTISVDPDPTLTFDVIGFIPSAPPLIATRHLRISNVAPRSSPPDVARNLHFAEPAFSVTALNGTLDELCVGGFDVSAGTCTGALPLWNNEAAGLEGGQTVDLPVRFIPQTAGLKSYDLVLYTNDPIAPEKHVTITAQAVVAGQCDYSVTPSPVDFGDVDGGTLTRDFTLHNDGANRCYFDSFALSADPLSGFSLPGAPVNLQVEPDAGANITVQLAPLALPSNGTQLTGQVWFSVPRLDTSTGRVELTAHVSY